MSRRRRAATPRASAFRDLPRRRVRIVCTGRGAHEPVALGGYWSPTIPGRPDISSVIEVEPGTPAPVLTALNVLVLEWRCKFCPNPVMQRSESWLREALQNAPATGVSERDVSHDHC